MRVMVLSLLVVMVGCGGDPNKKANELFVESVRLINSAEKKTGDAAIADYELALANVQQIIDEYSESDLAVKLVSGETLFSNESLFDIRARVEELKEEAKRKRSTPDPIAMPVFEPKVDRPVSPAKPVTSHRPAKTGKENPALQTGVAGKFEEIDQNRDGFIDRSEATGGLIREKFTTLDKNGDGRLSRQELKRALVKRKRRKK